MNKPKQAGTAWETELVRRAQVAGLTAARHAEGGSGDIADVWIGDPVPHPGDITVVAWKRLTGEGSRRTPDGERDVVVMRTEDLFALLATPNRSHVVIHIEAKARQTLNVTRELYKARWKVAKAAKRRELA